MFRKLLKTFSTQSNVKTHISICSDQHFQHIKKQIQDLTREIKNLIIKKCDKEHFYTKIQFWLQLKNILNMQRVCLAFYTGTLFYLDDDNHPETVAYDRSRTPFIHFTTSTMFEPLYSLKFNLGKAHLKSRLEYILSDGFKPSEGLNDLFASKTAFECRGSCQLASYLTLLDLFKLLYGEFSGKSAFDDLFKQKDSKNDHDFYRFRIGSMGDVTSAAHQKKYPEEFASIYFFTTYETNITLNDLKTKPQRYIGFNFYIKGHHKYISKHPDGAAQGWNAVFAGLHQNGDPLFLLARTQGEKYLLTYSKIIELLNDEFNRLPHFAQQYSQQTSEIKEMQGLQNFHWFFDLNKIKLLITNPKQFEINLTSYINQFYQTIFRKNGLHSLDNKRAAHYRPASEYLNQSFIRQTKDDSILYSQKRLRAKYKLDFNQREKSTQDDCLNDKVRAQRHMKDL